jgi:DNA-binding GntR family transcriptional regulator
MPKIENQALFELVYERIKTMLDDGVLSPGEKINKKILAETLGVSQTPVNEALSKLAGEKFLEQRSRQGFFIRQYSYMELSQLFELRAAIEGMAARLCAEHAQVEELGQMTKIFDGFTLPLTEQRQLDYLHADKLFHESLVRYSGNPFLMETFITSGYLPKSNQKGLIRAAEETLPEHMMIMNALRNRDAHLAQELTIIHLLRTRDWLRTLQVS